MTDQHIVIVFDGDLEEVATRLEEAGLKVTGKLKRLSVILAYGDMTVAQGVPGVKLVEPDKVVKATGDE